MNFFENFSGRLSSRKFNGFFDGKLESGEVRTLVSGFFCRVERVERVERERGIDLSHAEAQRYRERRGIWELRLRTRDSSGSEDWGIGGFSRGERVERVEGIGGLEDLAVENV